MLENNINSSSCTSTTTDCCFVECTTTTTISCINPIDQLFHIATISSEINDFNKLEALQSVLNEGFSLNSCGVCCPDCTYVFASSETYSKFVEAIYIPSLPSNSLPPLGANQSSSSDAQCCINIYGQEPGNLPDSANNDFFNITCCNNFTECVESIFQYFAENSCEVESDLGIFSLLQLYTTLLDIGVVEQGLINGESQVCTIFENMKNYFETTCFIEEFYRILETGIVIDCNDGKMFIGSPETYLKIIE